MSVFVNNFPKYTSQKVVKEEVSKNIDSAIEMIKLEEFNYNLFKTFLTEDVAQMQSIQEGTLLEEEIIQQEQESGSRFIEFIKKAWKSIKAFFSRQGKATVDKMDKDLNIEIQKLKLNRNRFYANLNRAGYQFKVYFISNEKTGKNFFPDIYSIFKSYSSDAKFQGDVYINMRGLKKGKVSGEDAKESKVAKDAVEIQNRALNYYLNAIINKGKFKNNVHKLKKDGYSSLNDFYKDFKDAYLQEKYPATIQDIRNQWDSIVEKGEISALIADIRNQYSNIDKICNEKIAECDKIINNSKDPAKIGATGGKNEAGYAFIIRYENIAAQKAVQYYKDAVINLASTYCSLAISNFHKIINMNSGTVAESYMSDIDYQNYLCSIESSALISRC